MKKIPVFIIIAVLVFSCFFSVSAAEEDIVIIYTNDVHSYIDNNVAEENENGLTYSKIAALKKSISGAILVDAGDHIQGTSYGSMDKGETIIELMNSAGYDVSSIGNHEFDYGMDILYERVNAANHKYVSCNFRHVDNGVIGDSVFDRYTIIERNGVKIAFVGIITPETFSATTPTYFQNEESEFIYSFMGAVGNNDASDFYSAVQQAIDDAKTDGADYVIALGHLGIEEYLIPYRSYDVIANTSGLTAFIDAHSHSVIESETVKDKNGQDVLLTQTGSYIENIGLMTISSDGVSSELLNAEDLADLNIDEATAEIENNWVEEINSRLGDVIGYSEIVLNSYNENGTRIVRQKETNLGDFAADSLYYLFDNMGMDVDVAIINGGGIRNKEISGELSYISCKEIHTFGNIACLITVSGQQILDALEWGVSGLSADPLSESGKFLQVSGAVYTVDLTIPSTVQLDDHGIWLSGPTGEYRVKNVMVMNRETGEYEALNLEAEYNLAGYNFILRNLGDGYAMFDGAENVLDYVAEDYMVLANYISSFPISEQTGLPTIAADGMYSNPDGNGRITIIKTSAEEETDVTTEITAESSDETESDEIGTSVEKDSADINIYIIIGVVIVVVGVTAFVIFKNKKK